MCSCWTIVCLFASAARIVDWNWSKLGSRICVTFPRSLAFFISLRFCPSLLASFSSLSLLLSWCHFPRYLRLYSVLRSLVASAAWIVDWKNSIGLIITTVLISVGSDKISWIVTAQKQIWFGIPLLPVLIIFFISCSAETNLDLVDLPQADLCWFSSE